MKERDFSSLRLIEGWLVVVVTLLCFVVCGFGIARLVEDIRREPLEEYRRESLIREVYAWYYEDGIVEDEQGQLWYFDDAKKEGQFFRLWINDNKTPEFFEDDVIVDYTGG